MLGATLHYLRGRDDTPPAVTVADDRVGGGFAHHDHRRIRAQRRPERVADRGDLERVRRTTIENCAAGTATVVAVDVTSVPEDADQSVPFHHAHEPAPSLRRIA